MRSFGSSFEARLMQKIQSAIPRAIPHIETNNPHFVGRIITIWDEVIKTTIELRLPDDEVEQWRVAEALYIARIVEHLKQVHWELEKAFRKTLSPFSS